MRPLDDALLQLGVEPVVAHHGQTVAEEKLSVVLQLIVSLRRLRIFGDAGTNHFVSASTNVLSMLLVGSPSLTVGW